MKNIILYYLVFLVPCLVFSQDSDDPFSSKNNFQKEETLFNHLHTVGIFGGPLFQFYDKNDEIEISAGGGGGIILNDFFIGLYGMGSSTDPFDEDIEMLDLAHGGLWLGYTFRQYKLVHLFSTVKAGYGGVNLDFDDEFDSGDAISFLNPEVGVELNVFRFFKLNATAGYRWVNGIDESISGIEKGSLDGFVAGVGLRFGFFGNRNRSRNRRNW